MKVTFPAAVTLSASDQGCQMAYFQTKNSHWGKFLRDYDWKNGNILWPFGIFYGHSDCFMAILYILHSFGTFFPVLVSWTKKNLATLSCCS
jgi:hypothetical protein